MPNTPIEILKESQKEFDEEFTFEGSGDWVDVDKLDAHKIKSHLTSITIKLLEGEIKRLNNQFKCLEDQISYLSAQLSEIKKT